MERSRLLVFFIVISNEELAFVVIAAEGRGARAPTSARIIQNDGTSIFAWGLFGENRLGQLYNGENLAIRNGALTHQRKRSPLYYRPREAGECSEECRSSNT